MDGQTVSLLFLLVGIVAGEYSSDRGGATSFAQVFNRHYESSDGPQYRPFGGSFPKDDSGSFQSSFEKKGPFPVKGPLSSPLDRPGAGYAPKPYQGPAAPQPYSGDHSVPYPAQQGSFQQSGGKVPYHYQPSYQHQDGYSQQYSPHLQ